MNTLKHKRCMIPKGLLLGAIVNLAFQAAKPALREAEKYAAGIKHMPSYRYPANYGNTAIWLCHELN